MQFLHNHNYFNHYVTCMPFILVASKYTTVGFSKKAADYLGRVRAWRNSIVGTTVLAAGLALGGPAQAETTAECVAKITADYDAKIQKAQAEGDAGVKKVALFTRKKAEYVEACGMKDQIAAADQRIAANRQEIAAADQRIAANRQEIAANKERGAAADLGITAIATVRTILDRVIAGMQLTSDEKSTLTAIRADIKANKMSPSAARAIEEGLSLIEQKLGTKVSPQ